MEPYELLEQEITQQQDKHTKRNKGATFNIFASSTDCISKKIKIKKDNVKDLDFVMSMYNLSEYIDNYSKTLGEIMAKIQRRAKCYFYRL